MDNKPFTTDAIADLLHAEADELLRKQIRAELKLEARYPHPEYSDVHTTYRDFEGKTKDGAKTTIRTTVREAYDWIIEAMFQIRVTRFRADYVSKFIADVRETRDRLNQLQDQVDNIPQGG